MYVIITCKYEKDPIKTNREKVATPFFQIIKLFVAMETSGRNWPNFELILACILVLIDVIFSIISLWDFFQKLKGSQLRSTWSDLAELRTHSNSYVYHRYLQV